MGELEKEIQKYFLFLHKNANGSIFQEHDQIIIDIKDFFKQKGIDTWIRDSLIKHKQINFAMEKLISEYKGHAQEKGKMDGFAELCGKSLLPAINRALEESTQAEEMPHQLRELLQIMNFEARKRFPQMQTEIVIYKTLLSRFIIPEINKAYTAEEASEITKSMQDYVQTVTTVPISLKPLFILSKEQMQQAVEKHVGSVAQVGTIFREEDDESLLAKRWIEYFCSEWIQTGFVENKGLKGKIAKLVLELQKTYKNDFSRVPEEIKIEWGKQLFLAAVAVIEKSEPPMPQELSILMQIINKEVAKRFTDSEMVTCSFLFLRALIPPMLISKETNTVAKKSTPERTSVIKCMQFYVNNGLKELPPSLRQLFQGN